MKRLLLLALALAFAATAAEAKTYYVNASRPNNNGNGLKASTAKKTIQAAVNLAVAGDTILVYPGEYAPFKTNNKKIVIKSVKGASQTKIVKTVALHDAALAQLGKPWTETYWDSYGKKQTYSSAPYTKGKDTTLAGFLFDGKNRSIDFVLGISGGTAKSCSIQRMGSSYGYGVAVVNATLTGSTIMNNQALSTIAQKSILSRCRILNNNHDDVGVSQSRLCHCLFVGNRNRYMGSYGTMAVFDATTLINCTIAENRSMWPYAPFSHKSKYYNCILRNNRRDNASGGSSVHNTDAGNTYSRTYQNNRDPKFASGGYTLAKGSPCIDQGTIPAAIKSLVGSVDLAGVKRIRGKAIDMGCYEY